MKDVQSSVDTRNIALRRVGVKNVSYPISLRDRSRVRQHTIATANMYVNLAGECKGTHMSRFVAILNEYHGDFDTSCLPVMLRRTRELLEAETARLEFSFPFFMEGETGRQRYQCTLAGTLRLEAELSMSVTVPLGRFVRVCGGGIEAVVAVSFQRFFWLEEIISLVEQGAAEAAAAWKAEGDVSTEFFCRAICRLLAPVTALRRYTVTVNYRTEECTSCATAGGGEI